MRVLDLLLPPGGMADSMRAHPSATPSPIKIFNYRDGGQEGWR